MLTLPPHAPTELTRNPYLIRRDRLGTLFTDADFADFFPKRGQPAYAQWRLAPVTLV